MSDGTVMQIAVQAIILATKLAGPFLIVSLAIGLGIGLLQSATQVQEQTLAFVPKLAGRRAGDRDRRALDAGRDHRLHPQPVRHDPDAAPVTEALRPRAPSTDSDASP